MIAITDIICQKIKDLKMLLYDSKDKEESDFFDKYGEVIFHLHDKILKIPTKALFIIVHRTYYKDENFSNFEKKIKQNEFLLVHILASTKCKSNPPSNQGLLGDEPFVISYELSQYIKNSIFDNEEYKIGRASCRERV